MGRIFVSGKTVSIMPDENERCITTNLKTLLNALKECRKTSSVFDIKSLKIGEIEISSKLHSYAYRAIKQKVTKNSHAKKDVAGVKVYLPVSCAKWLELKHGDQIVIETAVIDGEKVLVIRRARS